MEFFKENNELSMMRLMSFMVTLSAILVACFKSGDNVVLVTSMLGIAFGGKFLQKTKE